MENNNDQQLPHYTNQSNRSQPVVSSSQNMEIKTKEELINEKLKQGFVFIKITFQYLVDKKVKTISKREISYYKTRILVPPTETLLQIQQNIKNSFYKILAERNIKINPEDALFLFIKDHKIVDLSNTYVYHLELTVKEMANYMIDGPTGKELEITGATIESFGCLF